MLLNVGEVVQDIPHHEFVEQNHQNQSCKHDDRSPGKWFLLLHNEGLPPEDEIENNGN